MCAKKYHCHSNKKTKYGVFWKLSFQFLLKIPVIEETKYAFAILILNDNIYYLIIILLQILFKIQFNNILQF